MGKTQFSFILDRIYPVFCFNFCADGAINQQNIYKNFQSYTDELEKILNHDKNAILKSRKSRKIKDKKIAVYDSKYLFKKKDLKLLTIGFIWSLVEHSLNFDFTDSDGSWFKHYLKSRSVT